MIALPAFRHRMTVDEFLAWDSPGPCRYELVDGEPVAMAPARGTHGLLQNELGLMIGVHLREKRPQCRVIANPGIVPNFMSKHNFRIPDLGVTCAPVPPGRVMVEDCVFLAEILSPGNEAKTWSNVHAYVSIPSVSEILVVESEGVGVTIFRRKLDGGWPENPAQARDGEIVLESIDFRLRLIDLYEGSGLV